MSERRSHWTDGLIEAVYAELPAKKYQVEPDSWEVHRIIAAVEDWELGFHAQTEGVTHSAECWRWHQECARTLIEQQQAAIQRVRMVADAWHYYRGDGSVPTEWAARLIYNALDGERDE